MSGRSEIWQLSLVALAFLSACASGPDNYTTGAVFFPADAVYPPHDVAQPPFKIAAVVVPGTDHWSEIFHYAVPEPALVASGPSCGLVASSLPLAGPWRLAGVTPVYYTPILDIYTDGMKQKPINEPVYYHFRLSDDAR